MPKFNKNIIVKHSWIFIFVFLLCSGCGDYAYYYISTFDKAQAEQMMRSGRNTIIVNAFTKDPNDGYITTCAGLPVYLFPATERAKEYVKFFFGSEEGGKEEEFYVKLKRKRVKNSDPEFNNVTVQQVCDPKGFATFKAVGDGDFYVTIWTPSGPDLAYMYAKRFQVNGGETKTLVLRGESRRDSGHYGSYHPDHPNHEQYLENEQKLRWKKYRDRARRRDRGQGHHRR